jgi:hypothetical protein
MQSPQRVRQAAPQGAQHDLAQRWVRLAIVGRGHHRLREGIGPTPRPGRVIDRKPLPERGPARGLQHRPAADQVKRRVPRPEPAPVDHSRQSPILCDQVQRMQVGMDHHGLTLPRGQRQGRFPGPCDLIRVGLIRHPGNHLPQEPVARLQIPVPDRQPLWQRLLAQGQDEPRQRLCRRQIRDRVRQRIRPRNPPQNRPGPGIVQSWLPQRHDLRHGQG